MPPTDPATALRTHFGAYYLALNPDAHYCRWQQEVVGPALEDVERGKILRLMINIGFRYGKSEFSNAHFVAWYLGRNPKKTVIALSYNTALAKTFGSMIKNCIQSPLHEALFPQSVLTRDSRAKDEFSTISGGKFFAGGFKSGVNGRGAHLLIIDDPIKNRAEAQSEVIQVDLREKYKSTIRTRLEPNGAVVMIGTRWTPGDLFGWRIREDGAIDAVRGGAYKEPEVVEEAA